MYALGNVEKFVADNTARLGYRAKAILERARQASQDGVIMSGEIDEIVADPALTDEFRQVAMDPEHLKIGLKAMAATSST